MVYSSLIHACIQFSPPSLSLSLFFLLNWLVFFPYLSSTYEMKEFIINLISFFPPRSTPALRLDLVLRSFDSSDLLES